MLIFTSPTLRRKCVKMCQQSVRYIFQEQDTANALTQANLFKTPTKIKSERLPWSKYGGRYIVTMLPGSGIGPEMIKQVQDVFTVAHVPIDFEIIKQNGKMEDFLREALTAIRRNGVAIKANLRNILDEDAFISPNVTIRAELDLYVYVIHYKSFQNVKSRFSNVDIMLIRQNTEGEYAMLEHENVRGVVESLKIMTKENLTRVARYAFEFAVKNKRKKITAVHKDRVMQLSDGLFLDTIREMSAEYPEIELEDMYIDRCCRKLVTNPRDFDVLLMPNLYGTIVSNLICGLTGGAGLYSGVNYGEHYAIFEPATRHTGDDLIGRNIANPVAMLSASSRMLRFYGLHPHAQIIDDSIERTLTVDQIQTPDIGGINSTSEVVDNIKKYISENMHNYLS